MYLPAAGVRNDDILDREARRNLEGGTGRTLLQPRGRAAAGGLLRKQRKHYFAEGNAASERWPRT
jgi:hypothetical protein